jgi:hypothetical protein
MTYKPLGRRISEAITNATEKWGFENPYISLFSVNSMGNYNLEAISKDSREIIRLYMWNVHQMNHVGQEIRVNGHRVDLNN